MTKKGKAIITATVIVVVLTAGTVAMAITMHKKDDDVRIDITVEESVEIFSENLSDHVNEILISNDISSGEEATVLGALQPYIETQGKAVYVSNRAVDKDLDAEGYNVYTYNGQDFSIEFALITEDSYNTHGYEVVYVDAFQINTTK